MIAGVGGLFVLQGELRPDTWLATVYPDGFHMVLAGRYSTLDECTERAVSLEAHYMESTGREEADVYQSMWHQCGLNCELGDGGILLICEETVDSR